MLLSFERPARAGCPPRMPWPGAAVGKRAPPAILENCTVATAIVMYLRSLPTTGKSPNQLWFDHRQDSKGTWWMPWHLESMKGVDGCDKPR